MKKMCKIWQYVCRIKILKCHKTIKKKKNPSGMTEVENT